MLIISLKYTNSAYVESSTYHFIQLGKQKHHPQKEEGRK